MGAGKERLGRALLVSLVFHGALLSAAWPLWQQVAASRRPLVVVLGRTQGEAVLAPAPEVAEAARSPGKNPLAAARPAAAPGEKAATGRILALRGQGSWAGAGQRQGRSEKPAPVPAPAEPISLEKSSPGAPPAKEASSAPPSPASTAARERAPGQVDGAGLRRYRMNLALAAMGRYGGRALPVSLRGTVVLRLRRGLGPLTVAVAESSGNGALDEAARELVQAAGETAPLPESLGGLDFSFTLRLSFGED